MGYNLTKRISTLRRQAEENQEGRWGLLRTVFLATLALGFIALLLPRGQYISEQTSEQEAWYESVERQFSERLRWLEDSPLVIFPGAASAYEAYGKSVVSIFPTHLAESDETEEFLVSFAGLWAWVNRAITNCLLRIGFVVIAFWPLWLLSALAGSFVLKNRVFMGKTDDLLGVCDRGKGPFYSGIYGPLRPNSSFSGTDLSCPSLACPKMEAKNSALGSKLVLLLKEYGAFNETNLDLARVILAHHDFPAFVAEENPAYEEHENTGPEEARVSQTGFITNEQGMLKDRATDGLHALLEAHKKIRLYTDSLEKKGIKSAALSKNYPAHLANIKKLTSSMSPEARLLATALTPNRIWALGSLSPAVLASAYLATEAGKCLVYKRHDKGFVRISNYPHLQARAVIQSVRSYHREYNGDTRLMIRQAIICSRRHGDFGRAFLPNKMPAPSRALRDWLEIFWSEPANRADAASLVELDAHIEEISTVWKAGLTARLRKSAEERDRNPDAALVADIGREETYWKGVVYKSAVLMPLREVVKISLYGAHPERLKRISHLLNLTQKHQTRISISARLPGFKRQAMEAQKSNELSDKIIQNILTAPDGEALLEQWRIVRRMLTRYNWLSTRVGDDPVPLAGIVKGIVRRQPDAEQAPIVVGLESLVPLRQRRYVELLGKIWENRYYADAPMPEEVSIYIESEQYFEALREASKHSTGSDRQGDLASNG